MGERGFTLIETVIATAIAVMLLAAGGMWLLGMHPGALRNAVDDFDANLAAARATATTSGNGATMVFVPRHDGASGFELRVYSGRPKAPNLVFATNVMPVVSDATVQEATFGAPPFALFFSSAGLPTGTAHYPAIDAQGAITFPVIAQQPPCPAKGIVLTFRSPQGATETRTLRCDDYVYGTPIPNPSPTPLLPKITPAWMTAHWTTDTGGALTFIAAEFGYTHWFAKGDAACDGLATYDDPVPYATPPSAQEATLAPMPPGVPYSYPNTTVDPNDPPAPFRLSPIAGTPGECTLAIVDDYGQTATATVQVMGDLTPSVPSLTFTKPTDPPQRIDFTKTWDSEPLGLLAGGNCGGLLTVAASPVNPLPAPTDAPSEAAMHATLTVTPLRAGACTLVVTDQYHEPLVHIPVTVKSPPAPQAWPAGVTYPTLAGAIIAQAAPCAINQPMAYDGDPSSSKALANASDGFGYGLGTDANGCMIWTASNTQGHAPNTPVDDTKDPSIVIHEDGYAGAFSPSGTCNQSALQFAGWTTAKGSGPTTGVVMSPLAPTGSCTLSFADGSSKTANVTGQVVQATCVAPLFITPAGGTCTITAASEGFSDDSTVDCAPGGFGGVANHYLFRWSGGAGEIDIGAGGSLSGPDGVLTYSIGSDTLAFARTTGSTAAVSVELIHKTIHYVPGISSLDPCKQTFDVNRVASWTFN